MFVIVFFIGLIFPFAVDFSGQNEEGNYEENSISEVNAFVKWLEQKNISVKGISISTDEIIHKKILEKKDIISINEINNISNAIKIVYDVPDDVLHFINGKTLYISQKEGRGLTYIQSDVGYSQVNGLHDGVIFEQPFSKYTLIHEIGHIVDHELTDLRTILIKKEIFNNEFQDLSGSMQNEGFITSYSKINENENFAEHFVNYVLNAEKFRIMSEHDLILKAKYDFFRDYVFDGFEFEAHVINENLT